MVEWILFKTLSWMVIIMYKKLSYVSLGISFLLLLVLIFYVMKDSERENELKREVICQKIEDYTKDYFRLLENVEINTDGEKITVSVSFVPEAGSFPVKEEIYQEVAYHALQIEEFFPEVNHFDYIVLWDDYDKQKALTLEIDERAVKDLYNTFYNQYINQNSGFETSYRDVFSSVIETEISELWRNVADPNANVP